jgi:nonsense-mediated mRNA decay protein 3
MFCVECGSEEKLYGHLCRKCLLTKDLIVPPEYIAVQVCPGCGRVMDGPVWKIMAHEDVATRLMAEVTRTHVEVEKVHWDVPNFPPDKGEHRVRCSAVALIAGEELVQEFELGIRIRLINCPACSRQMGDYYEAVLQLRMDGLLARDAPVELVDENALILNTVSEHADTDEKAFITKHVPVKGGFDYYMGSVTLARAIAAKIRARTGASVNESPSLIGMKDGNDVYRYALVVKLPTFREGDIVAFNKKVHAVDKSDSKMLVLKNVSNGQIVRVEPDDANLRPVAKYRDLKTAVVVTHDKTSIQVLDPDSMAAVTLSRPAYLKNIGETVPVVRYDDALYIV